MAINFAEKYAAQVDERFATGSLTAAAVNNAYDWAGVNTVYVYSIPTVAMSDYEMSGASRYGVPSELDAGTQTMTLRKDRAFTFSIDRRSFESAMMTQEAGKALSRQIDEVVVPEIEVYRIAQMTGGAGLKKTLAVTPANAYDCFLEAVNALTEAKVPPAGRVALVTPRFYKAIKLDPSFMRSCDTAQAMLITGQVGLVDGVPLILAPSSYFPAGVGFVLTHSSATAAPVKLCEYKIHDNPPGINGWLVEGRVVYDAFVLDSKKNGIYVHYEA
ncbi:MAG: N4-gp56 family major capsid protein [Oscillospiraceae bacterium]|jgi:N4-gp56 family major capsid protein|nr:N4-gp56 family major capsid protein [Oscillospiraceae bacterium]